MYNNMHLTIVNNTTIIFLFLNNIILLCKSKSFHTSNNRILQVY